MPFGIRKMTEDRSPARRPAASNERRADPWVEAITPRDAERNRPCAWVCPTASGAHPDGSAVEVPNGRGDRIAESGDGRAATGSLAVNVALTTTSREPMSMPEVEVALPDRIDSEISRLVEQGEFLNREQAVEELLSMGVSAYTTTETTDEPEQDLFTQMTDDQQDPAARDDDGDEFTL